MAASSKKAAQATKIGNEELLPQQSALTKNPKKPDTQPGPAQSPEPRDKKKAVSPAPAIPGNPALEDHGGWKLSEMAEVGTGRQSKMEAEKKEESPHGTYQEDPELNVSSAGLLKSGKKPDKPRGAPRSVIAPKPLEAALSNNAKYSPLGLSTKLAKPSKHKQMADSAQVNKMIDDFI